MTRISLLTRRYNGGNRATREGGEKNHQHVAPRRNVRCTRRFLGVLFVLALTIQCLLLLILPVPSPYYRHISFDRAGFNQFLCARGDRGLRQLNRHGDVDSYNDHMEDNKNDDDGVVAASSNQKESFKENLSGSAATVHFLPLVFENTKSNGWVLQRPQYSDTTDYVPSKKATKNTLQDDDHTETAAAATAASSSRPVVSTDSAVVRLLGFIRVTKTGSTSVLNFLQSDVHPDLYTSDAYLHYDTFRQWTPDDRQRGSSGCIYGRLTTSSMRWQSPYNGPHDECIHQPYTELVQDFIKSLKFLDDRTFYNRNDYPFAASHLYNQQQQQRFDNQLITSSRQLAKPASTPIQVSLQLFTMVRDPFDRLVSYFYYRQAIYPYWSESSTPEQNARIKANDLVGWMHLLHTQGGSPASDIPNQHHYLASTIEDAVSLIDGKTPRVLVLLNECFHVSIQVLEERFPHLFLSGSAFTFLNYTTTTSGAVANRLETIIVDPPNNTSNETTPNDVTAASGYHSRRTLSPAKMQMLRYKAMQWFPEDYYFYQVAVRQFRLFMMTLSNLPKEQREQCEQRLNRYHL